MNSPMVIGCPYRVTNCRPTPTLNGAIVRCIGYFGRSPSVGNMAECEIVVGNGPWRSGEGTNLFAAEVEPATLEAVRAAKFVEGDRATTPSSFGPQPCVVLAAYTSNGERSYRVRYEGGLEANVTEDRLSHDRTETLDALRDLERAAR